MLTINLSLSLIMMTCFFYQVQTAEVFDTIYTPQHSPILLLPQEEKSYGYLISDSCNTKILLYSINYKYGREVLRDYLRMCYWKEYEKEETILWHYRSRLFYIIIFDDNSEMKDIKILDYVRWKHEESGDFRVSEEYFNQYEAIIKKALWDTAGDWVPEKEYSAQGYFYFDVF